MVKQEINPVRNNVLYYPYINLPESEWLTRMLLYYDKVGTITPPSYKTRPEKFMPYTLDLIKEDLVIQVFPYQYVYSVERFAESFKEYIDSLGDELKSRRLSFENKDKPFLPKRMKIHVSKMELLCDYLVKNRLAVKADNQWYDVEISTALDFMSYLAAIIGQVDEAGFIPITDNVFPINRLVKSISHDVRIENTTGALRIQLLKGLLPSPSQPLKAEDILRFKMRHGDKLSEFRNYVEQSILDILRHTDEDLRERQIVLFNQKAQEDIEEIKAFLQEHGWINIAFVNLYALLSEIPVIGMPMKIILKVYKASTDSYSTNTKMVKETPLLYAAVAQKELLKN